MSAVYEDLLRDIRDELRAIRGLLERPVMNTDVLRQNTLDSLRRVCSWCGMDEGEHRPGCGKGPCPCGDQTRPGHPTGWCCRHV